jgi:hypothetical protein
MLILFTPVDVPCNSIVLVDVIRQIVLGVVLEGHVTVSMEGLAVVFLSLG